MSLMNVVKRTEHSLRENSPVILTGLGVSGLVTTAYLAGKTTLDIAREFDDELWRHKKDGAKKFFKLWWKNYIPTAISGVLSVGCIIGGARLSAKRTATALSLLTISERAFSEYKDKIVEKIGEKKEQAVRDEIAKERISKNPPGLIIVGSGKVLCYEAHTGRYFECDMETLRQAENEINARLIREGYATLDDFYDLVGLEQTSTSGRIIWDSDKMLKLTFSPVLTKDGRPCISFEYNYVKSF